MLFLNKNQSKSEMHNPRYKLTFTRWFWPGKTLDKISRQSFLTPTDFSLYFWYNARENISWVSFFSEKFCKHRFNNKAYDLMLNIYWHITTNQADFWICIKHILLAINIFVNFCPKPRVIVTLVEASQMSKLTSERTARLYIANETELHLHLFVI